MAEKIFPAQIGSGCCLYKRDQISLQFTVLQSLLPNDFLWVNKGAAALTSARIRQTFGIKYTHRSSIDSGKQCLKEL